MGSYRTYSIPGKTAALVPKFVVEDLPSAELQLSCLCFQSETCPWAEHSYDHNTFIIFIEEICFLYGVMNCAKLLEQSEKQIMLALIKCSCNQSHMYGQSYCGSLPLGMFS